MRTITASERRFNNQLQCAVTLTLAQVLINNALGSVLAPSAAASNREFVLHVEERASTAIDRLTDVSIGHGMAYADVHRGPSFDDADGNIVRRTVW
jgi:hypothetical protein